MGRLEGQELKALGVWAAKNTAITAGSQISELQRLRPSAKLHLLRPFTTARALD